MSRTSGPIVAACAVLGSVAVVHAVRGAEIDSLFWAFVLGCLLIEDLTLRGVADRRAEGFGVPFGRVVEGSLLAGLAALSVLVAGRWPIGSMPAKIVIAVLGVLVLVAVFTRRVPVPAPEAAPRQPRGWPWLLIIAVACVVQLVHALAAQNAGEGAPTFSGVVDLLLAQPVVRGVAFALWLLAGYYLLCRTTVLRRRG